MPLSPEENTPTQQHQQQVESQRKRRIDAVHADRDNGHAGTHYGNGSHVRKFARASDGQRAVAEAIIDSQYAIGYTENIISSMLEFLDNRDIAQGPALVNRAWNRASWVAFRPTCEDDDSMFKWVVANDKLELFERVYAHHTFDAKSIDWGRVLLIQARSRSYRIFDAIQ